MQVLLKYQDLVLNQRGVHQIAVHQIAVHQIAAPVWALFKI